MNTLSISKLETLRNHPILRNVFYDILQRLRLQGRETLELSDDQLADLQWSGGTWDGAQWSGGDWNGAQWGGGDWSGADWSGDY